MNRQVTAFLDQFDEGLRPQIIEFGKRISSYSNDFDVVILMARKAVCFSEALRSLKITSYQGIVTSDRVLDLNTDWLKNKNIAIVDDGIVTGTTLYKTIRILESIGCEVKVFVLCVNNDFWSKSLVVPEMPYINLDDKDTASLCFDIVNAISVVPTPYSTDYPTFGSLKISRDDLNLIYNSGRWNITDVSSSLQNKYDVFSKTFEPDKFTITRIKSILGEPYIDSALIKIRLYGRWFDESRKQYLCNILPIFALEPLKKEDIDLLFSAIAYNSNVSTTKFLKWFSNDIADNSNIYKAKLRLIQFYCAHKTAELFIEDIQFCIKGNIVFKQDEQSLSFLFPFPIVKDISSLVCTDQLFNRLKVTSKLRLPKPFNYFPTANKQFLGDDGWSIESCLTKPFMYLYQEYEIPARKLALKYGKRIFTDEEICKQHAGLINRLERGFSLGEMREWLNHLNDKDIPINRAISKFIDTSIDRGIVVPTTCVIGDYVFRGYRHGEDVVFGESEKKLLAHTLKAYSDASGKDLSGKEIEKTTVLAVKKFLDRGYLVQAPKNLIGRPGSIGIRFSLHGAVVEEGSVKIYAGGSGCSIRTILCESNYLKLKTQIRSHGEKNTYEVIFDGRDRNGIKMGGAQDAILFGKLIGDLRKKAYKKIKAKLTVDDLILLATISSPKDIASALAAEVSWANSVFRRYYTIYVSFVFNDDGMKSSIKKFKDMRNVDTDQLFACLSSGTWKYNNFKMGTAWKIVKTVLDGLDDDNEIYQKNLWEQFWKETLNQSSATAIPIDLNQVIDKQAEWLFHMRILLAMLQAAFLYHGRSTIEKSEYNTHLSQLKSEIGSFIDKCRSFGCSIDFKVNALLERIDNETLKASELRHYCLEKMNIKLLEANDILTSIDCIVQPYGEIGTLLEYDSIALLLWDTKQTNSSYVMREIENNVLNKFKAYNEAGRASVDSITIVSNEFHSIDNCIMIGGYSPPLLNFLIYTSCEILTKFIRYADIAIVIIHDIPSQSYLRRAKGTTDFFNNFLWHNIKAIERFIKDKHYSNCLVSVTQDKELSKANLASHTKQKIQQTFNSESENHVLTVAENCEYQLTLEKHSLNQSLKEALVDNLVDVGIISIVSDEIRAVDDYLKKYPGYQSEFEGEKYSYDFTLGSLTARDGQRHSVACIQALGQGNTSVMPAYQALCDEFNPKLVVLLGIGGSVHEDLGFCDVCVADHIINYEKRAETPDGPKHTFDPLPPIEPWLIRIYQRLERQYGENIHLRAGEGSEEANFKVLMGPIGSGEAVVKDEDSHVREWLNIVSRKTKAVETEAVGTARQFQSDKLKKDSRTKGYLVIRGISDCADPNKDKKYRYIPARNAMIFLDSLLSHASKGFNKELGG